MGKISKFDLISGVDIYIDGVCTIHQPTLDEIRKLGYDKYTIYTNVLMMDIDDYFKIANVSDKIISETRPQITMFDLLFFEDRERVLLKEALSFFIVEDIGYSQQLMCYTAELSNGNIGFINRDNYEIIRTSIIAISSYGHSEETEEALSEDPEIREMQIKINKGKAALQKAKSKSTSKNESLSLSNMIAALCAYHNSYNLTTVWSLTVYQLYDQFFRQNYKNQLDTFSTRWAVWGKEDNDFTTWFKDQNNK